MTTEAGFLAAIVAEPEDDASRLVFADWLDDHGLAERAEFIRGQVELARVKEDSPSRRRLARRMHDLLESRGGEWLSAPGAHQWRFVRGFIDRVGIDGDDLRRRGAELFAAAPVTRLWVSGLKGDVGPLAAIPRANALAGLDLSFAGLTAETLDAVARLAHLPRLRSLVLSFNALDDACVSLLCKRRFFQRLSLLRLGANPISEAGRRRLREHFGERVSFACERDEDHLYALQPRRRLDPCRGADLQFMFPGWDEGVRLVAFDYEGNLLQVLDRERAEARQDDWYFERPEVIEEWMEELGCQPATITFRRFALDDGQHVRDFYDTLVEAFEEPDDSEENVANRASAERWFRDGEYAWEYGGRFGDFWVDGEGRITAT